MKRNSDGECSKYYHYEIEEFLVGEMNDDEVAQLHRHMDSCDSCRQRLEAARAAGEHFRSTYLPELLNNPTSAKAHAQEGDTGRDKVLRTEASRDNGSTVLTEARRSRVDRLYRKWEEVAFRRGMQMLGNEAYGEDVRQRTFLRILTSIHNYDDRELRVAFVYTVATREALNLIRELRKKLPGTWFPAEGIPDRIDVDDLVESRDMLDHALSVLNERELEMVYYRYFEGRSLYEVEDRVGLSRKTVTKKLTKAVARMRRAAGLPKKPERSVMSSRPAAVLEDNARPQAG